MSPAEIGLEACVPPSGLFQDARELPEGVRGPFYLAVSSNGLNGLPCRISGVHGPQSFGIIHPPWLRPDHAAARVGRTIYIFLVMPKGGDAVGRQLTMQQLAGCIRQIGPDDITGTP